MLSLNSRQPSIVNPWNASLISRDVRILGRAIRELELEHAKQGLSLLLYQDRPRFERI